MSHWRCYMIFGYYDDNRQRFSETYEATSHDDAEEQALAANSALIIVGSYCLDTDEIDPFAKTRSNYMQVEEEEECTET